MVSVPEIRIDLMKLLLHLHYQERVLLNTEQLAKVTNYIHMFGMTWSHLHYFQVDGNGPNTVMTEAPIPRSNLEMRVVSSMHVFTLNLLQECLPRSRMFCFLQ